MTRLKKIRFIEFLVVGLLMGISEDLLAIFFATDAKINLNVIWIVIIVALPFAFISEFIVDHPRFWEKLLPENKIK
ncbi:MAG: hypothetical protein ABIE43_01800 [Patescibacteria group bacterium]